MYIERFFPGSHARQFDINLRKQNFSGRDRTFIMASYGLAKALHTGQKRESGESYFHAHCVPVAEQLLKWNIRSISIIAAALLHDVVEDSPRFKNGVSLHYKRDEVRNFFLKRLGGFPLFRKAGLQNEIDLVTHIVMAMTKDNTIDDKTTRTEEYQRRLEGADKNVWIIKFADRLHNFQTMEHLSKEKQERKVIETMDLLPLFVLTTYSYPAERDVWTLISYMFQYVGNDKRQELRNYVFNYLALDKILASSKPEDFTIN